MKIDLEFFPALRDTCCSVEMIELRSRNLNRLEQAKQQRTKVFRPAPLAHWHSTSYQPGARVCDAILGVELL